MHVAVIGGGYAGLAAAVTLAGRGVPVTVYESASVLGGRARRITVDGASFDNGQHILIGAYTETLRLIGEVNPETGQALLRYPLHWQIHERFQLRVGGFPTPLHMLAAVLGARGAPMGERVRAVQFMRAMRARRFQLDRDTTVHELLLTHRQGETVSRCLWHPLCVAALNTPPAKASAQVFLNVLHDSLDGARDACDILLPRVDLSALFPEPAARYIDQRGGRVLTRHRVTAIGATGGGFEIEAAGARTAHTHVICAVAPFQLPGLCSDHSALAQPVDLTSQFTYQPIYTVYLQFTQTVKLPFPMLGLDGALTQWVFDRDALSGQRGLLAAIISAEGDHQHLTQDALAQRVHAEIRERLHISAPLEWHRVIAEKRATFAATPGLQRPGSATGLRNFYLAGDYIAGSYPATLEAAVRSGVASARMIA